MLIGAPVDPFFRLPLWLRTAIVENVLFAYNYEHLQFLEDFIGAKLRSRGSTKYGWANQSFESRLLTWMTSARNRAKFLKAIANLKAK
ncbi:hypothetical protein [Solirubrum puertoriconensis]|uniref:Uncharacterized protein n=1 Tax=Solirubrum puertoriconensis TaxID=1751427 RepID=A0A9X0L4F2_SOLP1|nr:hypothetical protein [Solirubrum puertoriconensis]KUG07357.1 hypothetical protein ASU33_13445 [Solirubrum puertoriconensis]